MKASGPFAMGPSLVGRRPVRSNFTPLMPPGPSKGGTLGLGLTRTTAPTLGVKREPNSKDDTKAESDEEVYSDPEDGVEIVDMQNIRKMDWMAPETLKRESEYKRKVKPKKDDKKSLAEQAELDRGEGLCRDFVLEQESDFNFRRYGCRRSGDRRRQPRKRCKPQRERRRGGRRTNRRRFLRQRLRMRPPLFPSGRLLSLAIVRIPKLARTESTSSNSR